MLRGCKVELRVRLGRPLGQLSPAQLDALRERIGPWLYNGLSALDSEVRLLGLGEVAKAVELAEGLRTAGFEVETIKKDRYSIRRDHEGESTELIVEEERAMAHIVKRMIEAGVPVDELDLER